MPGAVCEYGRPQEEHALNALHVSRLALRASRLRGRRQAEALQKTGYGTLMYRRFELSNRDPRRSVARAALADAARLCAKVPRRLLAESQPSRGTRARARVVREDE